MQRKNKNKHNLGEALFFVLIFLFGAPILLVSPFFEVREIAVQGNQELTCGKIIAASELTPGTNIFKVNLSLAKAGIQKLPMVKEVIVTRALPAKIIIRVEERKPVVLFPAKDGFIALDREGVYCRNALVGEKNFPVVTGIQADIPRQGEVIEDDKLKVVLGVVENLPSDLVTNLSEVNLDQDGQVILYTLQGTKCKLGYPEDITEKGAVLMRVLSGLNDRKMEYIDLSLPSAPVVKISD